MDRKLRVYAGSAGRFDMSRNTSMVKPVPHGEGLRTAAYLRAHSDTEWYRWVVGGRPVYTEHEYKTVRKTGAPVASTP